LKRALKKRVEAVLENTPSEDALVEEVNQFNPRVNRRVPTKAAMIGLAISMGASSFLVTQQSDQALAAEPVASEKAASVTAAPDTEVNFAPTQKLESQAVSSVSVPENPAIVEPTAISHVPGLGAKWQFAGNGISGNKKPQAAEGLSVPSVNTKQQTANKLSIAYGVAPAKTTSLNAQPQIVATVSTQSSEVNAQLKAQQEFAINRLRQKSDRLRESLTELHSEQSKDASQSVTVAASGMNPGSIAPSIVATKSNTQQSETLANTSRASLVSRLKQSSAAQLPVNQTPTSVAPSSVAPSASSGYAVKSGDTLATIAQRSGTSVSELVKANNLNNPNQLQISQKLIIPTAVESNIAQQTPMGLSGNTSFTTTNTIAAENASPKKVASGLVTPENNVNPATAPSSTGANTVASTVTPEVPNSALSYGVGGETPIPKAFAQMQLAKRPPVTENKAKGNQRLRSLKEEIERLQAKYRSQESGNPVASEVAEVNSAAVSVPVYRPNAVSVPVPVYRPNTAAVPIPIYRPDAAVQIPVPRPMQPTYSAQPIQPRYRGTVQANEPVNPEFRQNSGIRVATPNVGNASQYFGGMRGTAVSPELPPLAAVGDQDRYLPKTSIDENTPIPSINPGSSTVGYIWPAKGVLTSGFGRRWGRPHKGIDIAAPTGTPVYASSDGVIEKAGWNNGGYGNLVDIRHADGTITRYGHNSKILVGAGQQVRQGQQIALMGSTGFSTGPHTHFEIHPGGKAAVNPIAFLPPRV
jgi:murein DD-endopeptidase MepM/ murein hydrolase activator NlpD